MPPAAPDDELEEVEEDEDRAAANKTRFMVSLGKPQLAGLRAYARRKGLSVAEVVRRAVDEFLDRRPADPSAETADSPGP